MNKTNSLLKSALELLVSKEKDGIWTSPSNPYAYKEFSFDQGKVTCDRYEFKKFHENIFDGLDELTIENPESYEWDDIISMSIVKGDVHLVVVDGGKKKNLVLKFYPSL